MYIGKISAITGASRKAIRLYEEMGLIAVPERRGTYRIYNQQHVVIVNMIKRAQEVGFKLTEISSLIDIKMETNQFPVEFAIELIEQKRNELSAEIARIEELDEKLEKLIVDLPLLEINGSE